VRLLYGTGAKNPPENIGDWKFTKQKKKGEKGEKPPGGGIDRIERVKKTDSKMTAWEGVYSSSRKTQVEVGFRKKGGVRWVVG